MFDACTFLIKIVLTVQVLYEFSNYFFYFCEKYFWDFDMDSVESVNSFNNIISSQSMNMEYFPFICVFFSFFHQFHTVFSASSFNYLKFIPKYFILFGTILNDGIFLIPFHDKSLVGKNTTFFVCIDFFILQLD